MNKNYWSENELILALHLYVNLSYNEIHKRNSKIISLANLINRSISSIIMRLNNYVHCDPLQRAKGIYGLDGGLGVCQPIWDRYYYNTELLNNKVKKITQELSNSNSHLNNNITQVTPIEFIWVEIIRHLEKNYNITYSGNNPFLLWLNSTPYYIFLRNLTRAYKDHSLDVCRIQLPKNAQFETIKNSNIPLVILGFCNQYNTFANWSSVNIKPRLNDKKNVSLYSRFSQQAPTDNNSIRKFELGNGEIVSIVSFDKLPLLFSSYSETNNNGNSTSFQKKSPPKLNELFSLLTETTNDSSELRAIQICISYFEKKQIEYNLLQIRDLIKRFKKGENTLNLY